MKNVILSGMRPTGKLHIGHLSVLDNWVKLQSDYECYYAVTDWHALTTALRKQPSLMIMWNMVLDWLAVELDPEKAQYLYNHRLKNMQNYIYFFYDYSLILAERVPTYKVKFTSLVYKERTFLPMDFRLSFANVCRYSIISSKRCTGWRRSTAHLELCRGNCKTLQLHV